MNIDKTRTYNVGGYSFVNFINLDDTTYENIRVWRNHPDIRKVMYHKEEISKEEHRSFLNILKNSTTKSYWYVSKGMNPIGVVSVFDIDEVADRAELGYYLFPTNLYSGVAVEFISFAYQFLFEEIGFQTIYGGTNEKNTDALLLNQYFGGEFGSKKELNGETFINFETSKQRFEERKEGSSNWRNFVKYCKSTTPPLLPLKSVKFHHFGVACRDIDKTAKEYIELGYIKGETIFDPLQNIDICFLSHHSMPLIELLSPVDENSPVVRILEKNGVTPYHICYEVENLEESIMSFKMRRYVIVSKPKNACAIRCRRVSFLYHADMGLIELVEK